MKSEGAGLGWIVASREAGEPRTERWGRAAGFATGDLPEVDAFDSRCLQQVVVLRSQLKPGQRSPETARHLRQKSRARRQSWRWEGVVRLCCEAAETERVNGDGKRQTQTVEKRTFAVKTAITLPTNGGCGPSVVRTQNTPAAPSRPEWSASLFLLVPFPYISHPFPPFTLQTPDPVFLFLSPHQNSVILLLFDTLPHPP